MADTVTNTTSDAALLEVFRSTLPFDLSCTHSVPGSVSGRCQLWAGHDGEHAVMYSRDGARIVRSWRDNDLGSVRDGADCRAQPWARGFPQSAWHEHTARAHRQHA